MLTLTRRHAAIGTVTLALSLAAIVAGVTASSRPAQAQPNPGLLAQQPPASCVCADSSTRGRRRHCGSKTRACGRWVEFFRSEAGYP